MVIFTVLHGGMIIVPNNCKVSPNSIGIQCQNKKVIYWAADCDVNKLGNRLCYSELEFGHNLCEIK